MVLEHPLESKKKKKKDSQSMISEGCLCNCVVSLCGSKYVVLVCTIVL